VVLAKYRRPVVARTRSWGKWESICRRLRQFVRGLFATANLASVTLLGRPDGEKNTAHAAFAHARDVILPVVVAEGRERILDRRRSGVVVVVRVTRWRRENWRFTCFVATQFACKSGCHQESSDANTSRSSMRYATDRNEITLRCRARNGQVAGDPSFHRAFSSRATFPFATWTRRTWHLPPRICGMSSSE